MSHTHCSSRREEALTFLAPKAFGVRASSRRLLKDAGASTSVEYPGQDDEAWKGGKREPGAGNEPPGLGQSASSVNSPKATGAAAAAGSVASGTDTTARSWPVALRSSGGAYADEAPDLANSLTSRT